MTSNDFHGLRVTELDAVDRAIVRELQEDGRRSVAMIAKRIGLSHAGTRQRVQRLLESRIVQIGAVTAPETHGYRIQAVMGIRTDHRVRDVAAALDALDEAYYVVICGGTLDLVAEVMCRDDEHLIDLTTRVRQIPGVRSTETHRFLELTKWRYAPDFVEGPEPLASAVAER